ncbi:MAG TPA: gamma-glutamylcyclotransferase [Burkholderiaceae bacterium]|nr:gamma-glutamylcyclotransferase [Burkholderiaceae bacterium]
MSNAETFRYFAYGSNMLTRRLLERTPSARVVGTATLPEHELRWHKVSKDGSAKCDIVRSSAPQACVHGIVFEIALADKAALDVAEGIGMGYKGCDVVVNTARGALSAWTYRATNIDPLARPYPWYKAFVVAGAKEHGLPAAYVAALEAVVTREDPKPERAAQNGRLVALALRDQAAATADPGKFRPAA